MLCANVFSRREKRGVVEADMTGTAVHHTEPDPANLLPMTPTLLQAIVSRLEFGQANMNARDLDELQTRSGWNYEGVADSWTPLPLFLPTEPEVAFASTETPTVSADNL